MSHVILSLTFCQKDRNPDRWHDYYIKIGDDLTDEDREEVQGNFRDDAMEFLAALDPADVYGIVEKKHSFKIYYVRREANA